MADGEPDSAEFKTGLFGLKLIGRDALITFLFIIMLAQIGVSLWQHKIRQDEHDQITCMIKLNLFVNQQKSGELLDWSKMPVDLYGCVPKFLYENARPLR